MVYYFTSTVEDPPVTLFMGKDKYENEVKLSNESLIILLQGFKGMVSIKLLFWQTYNGV